jgi:hypothetical protein
MSITVSDFKQYFTRDFPYLPVWDALVSYNKDEVVYYETTRLFYIALSNTIPAGTLPTNTTYFSVTSDDYYNYINDTDITKAIGECDAMLPVARFETEVLATAQNYLTAHCLCNDIKTSNAGLANSAIFAVQSKSAGSISESFGIPQRLLQSPFYAFYITSQFGMKYLAMLYPRCIGALNVAEGATTP